MLIAKNLRIVTERARKLRAQYALQAQDLRSRIHRRVNRIPLALRKTTMGELLERHSMKAASSSNETLPAKKTAGSKTTRGGAAASASRGADRLTNTSVATSAPKQTRRVNRAT